MQSKRSRLALLGILALALSVTAGLVVSDVAAAKKKKKAKVGGTVDITKAVNAPILDATAAPSTIGTLVSTIDVGGKKFKGTKVRDVNVTLQTTGATGTSPLGDLSAQLTAPNGATTWLIGVGLSGLNLGPLTLDDESVNALQAGAPPARNPNALASPYVGVAQPYCFFARGGCTLSAMDNGGVTGTWTLRVFDETATETSVLNSWRLTVVAGKAFLTK